MCVFFALFGNSQRTSQLGCHAQVCCAHVMQRNLQLWHRLEGKTQRSALRTVFRPSSRGQAAQGQVYSGRHHRPARGRNSSGQRRGMSSTRRARAPDTRAAGDESDSRARLQRAAPRNVFHPSSRWTGGSGTSLQAVGTMDRRGRNSSGPHWGRSPPAAPELQIDGRLGNKSAVIGITDGLEGKTPAANVAGGLPPAAPEPRLKISGRLGNESSAAGTGSRAVSIADGLKRAGDSGTSLHW